MFEKITLDYESPEHSFTPTKSGTHEITCLKTTKADASTVAIETFMSGGWCSIDSLLTGRLVLFLSSQQTYRLRLMSHNEATVTLVQVAD